MAAKPGMKRPNEGRTNHQTHRVCEGITMLMSQKLKYSVPTCRLIGERAPVTMYLYSTLRETMQEKREKVERDIAAKKRELVEAEVDKQGAALVTQFEMRELQAAKQAADAARETKRQRLMGDVRRELLVERNRLEVAQAAEMAAEEQQIEALKRKRAILLKQKAAYEKQKEEDWELTRAITQIKMPPPIKIKLDELEEGPLRV